MKGKCILLVRVSTERQHFDAQMQELFDMALKDGYKESDIIAIAEKESGIKLKEDERKGLLRMKETIAAETINCVYAWEISRISRKQSVLYSILEYLQERNINLIIKEPYISLLNEDGTTNDASMTIFSLYATLSESEMRNKRVRMQRGVEENAKKGKFNGGKYIKYGYCVNSENYIIPNHTKDPLRNGNNVSEVEIVQMIYEMHSTRLYSCASLAKELDERGYKNRGRKIIGKWVNDILTKNGLVYCKGISKESKHGLTYTPIIEEKQYNVCQSILKANDSVKDRTRKGTHLGSKIVVCKECGSHCYVQHGTYICVENFKKKLNVTPKCNNAIQLNATLIDTLLFVYAKREYIETIGLNLTEKINEIINEVEVLRLKQNNLKSEYEKKESARERINDLYADGEISKAQWQNKLANVKATMQELNETIAANENRIENLISLQKELEERSNNFGRNFMRAMREAEEKFWDMDFAKAQIAQYVDKCYFEKVDNKTYIITIVGIFPKDGFGNEPYKERYIYHRYARATNRYVKKKSVYVEQLNEDGTTIPFENIDALKPLIEKGIYKVTK